MKITQEVTAWIPNFSGITLEQFKDPSQLPLASLGYLRSGVDMSSSGWTRIGIATITLEVPTPDAILNAKAESLRAEIIKAKADAARTIAILEDRLSKLLALPMTAEVKQ